MGPGHQGRRQVRGLIGSGPGKEGQLRLPFFMRGQKTFNAEAAEASQKTQKGPSKEP